MRILFLSGDDPDNIFKVVAVGATAENVTEEIMSTHDKHTPWFKYTPHLGKTAQAISQRKQAIYAVKTKKRCVKAFVRKLQGSGIHDPKIKSRISLPCTFNKRLGQINLRHGVASLCQ